MKFSAGGEIKGKVCRNLSKHSVGDFFHLLLCLGWAGKRFFSWKTCVAARQAEMGQVKIFLITFCPGQRQVFPVEFLPISSAKCPGLFKLHLEEIKGKVVRAFLQAGMSTTTNQQRQFA